MFKNTKDLLNSVGFDYTCWRTALGEPSVAWVSTSGEASQTEQWQKSGDW